MVVAHSPKANVSYTNFIGWRYFAADCRKKRKAHSRGATLLYKHSSIYNISHK
jgi:hypothetical protein